MLFLNNTGVAPHRCHKRCDMETLLLHLDEELINNRPGRSRRTNYDVDALAFWTQFYSLFYDSVFVPANFLTDSNLTPLILERMGILDPRSAIRTQDGPFKILWDTSRFPFDSFREMVRGFATDESTVTLRDITISRTTAELCDKFLSRRIVRADMAAKLDPKESVQQLSHDVFSPSGNEALPEHQLSRLNECLTKIVDRGDILERGDRFGYGRNFYYTVFGYGKTEFQLKLSQQFADITRKYNDLRHEFLTAVDYVSHRLKAKFAGHALGKEIGVLIPNEYNWIVVPPNKIVALASGLGRAQPTEVGVKEKFRYLLDRESIINITAENLHKLHGSNEFKWYKAALEDLRWDRQVKDEQETTRREKNLEDCLGAYIERITNTLNPKRHKLHSAITMAVEGIPTVLGFTARIVLGGLREPTGASQIPEGEISTVSHGVEVFSRSTGSRLVDRMTKETSIECNTIQLSEDINIYFR